jgi:hypothetical protein
MRGSGAGAEGRHPGRRRLAGVLAALAAACLLPAGTFAASPPPPVFAVIQMELLFQNGRPDITVPRNFPGLRAYARATFRGTGLLEAFWMVDDRILADVSEPVMFGESLLFASPQQPPLPTFEPGLHRVTLQLRNPPGPGRVVPTIAYFVTADEFVPPAR